MRFCYYIENQRPMEKTSIDSFREKLDNEYNWPSLYTFKFIIPKGKKDEIAKLFPQHDIVEKPSSNGNYISLTIKVMAQSSKTIIEYYVKASHVKGVIAL